MMDELIVSLCLGGLIFFGFLVGYPIGAAMGRREALSKLVSDQTPAVVAQAECRLKEKDILLAEYLEVKQ